MVKIAKIDNGTCEHYEVRDEATNDLLSVAHKTDLESQSSEVDNSESKVLKEAKVKYGELGVISDTIESKGK